MKIYKVIVYDIVTKWHNEQGQMHREGGLPAIEWADGDKSWYINGNKVTEAEAIAHFKPKVKELTMQELAALLGYEVKIIK